MMEDKNCTLTSPTSNAVVNADKSDVSMAKGTAKDVRDDDGAKGKNVDTEMNAVDGNANEKGSTEKNGDTEIIGVSDDAEMSTPKKVGDEGMVTNVDDSSKKDGRTGGNEGETPKGTSSAKKKSRRKNKKKKDTNNAKKGGSNGNTNATAGEIAGMIFMCSSRTKSDCYRYKVLGLPAAKKDVVSKVLKGMKLFLFDFDTRLLYGIYKAQGNGGSNIVPKAFNSAFPSQVKFRVVRDCEPLPEDTFKRAIKDNYYSRNKFNCELTPDQVKGLCKLFRVGGRAPRFSERAVTLQERNDRARLLELEARRRMDAARVDLEEERLGRLYRRAPVMYETDVIDSPRRVPPQLPYSVPIYDAERAYDYGVGRQVVPLQRPLDLPYREPYGLHDDRRYVAPRAADYGYARSPPRVYEPAGGLPLGSYRSFGRY